jgi:hypothetical protein
MAGEDDEDPKPREKLVLDRAGVKKELLREARMRLVAKGLEITDGKRDSQIVLTYEPFPGKRPKRTFTADVRGAVARGWQEWCDDTLRSVGAVPAPDPDDYDNQLERRRQEMR